MIFFALGQTATCDGKHKGTNMKKVAGKLVFQALFVIYVDAPQEMNKEIDNIIVEKEKEIMKIQEYEVEEVQKVHKVREAHFTNF